MQRILLSLLALTPLTGACDDPAAVAPVDSADLQFRGLCDEHPISAIFWEGIQPWGDPEQMEQNWCAFMDECNAIGDGKPVCVDKGALIDCTCGGVYSCVAFPELNDYTCSA